MQGEISKSMGVDTKPAHKFEINGYWLMLDPNADEATVQYVKDITINCATCKHSETDAFDMPCMSCIRISEFGTNKWEAKSEPSSLNKDSIEQNCKSCKYEDLDMREPICWNCCVLAFNKNIVGFKNNWEAKQ